VSFWKIESEICCHLFFFRSATDISIDYPFELLAYGYGNHGKGFQITPKFVALQKRHILHWRLQNATSFTTCQVVQANTTTQQLKLPNKRPIDDEIPSLSLTANFSSATSL
jgi:hypothetical protein